MQLGWIDFSKEDRQKALDVINLLSEKGAVDELGIGIVRDGFANYFFPGTSTIQTRAKYFLIVPYVLKEAVDGRYGKDVNRILRSIDADEKDCGIRLLADSPDAEGIIGMRVLPKGWVARKPSDIYWNGIRTYGIFRNNSISIPEYVRMSLHIAEQKKIKRLGNRNDDAGENDKDDIDAGDLMNFQFWDIPVYTSNWRENLSVELTKEEAVFLDDKIQKATKGTLLEYVLRNRIHLDEYISFAVMAEDMKDKVDGELAHMLKLACDFNQLIYMARVRYNVLLSENENEVAVEEWKRLQVDCDKRASVDLKAVFEKLNLYNPGTFLFLGKLQEAFISKDISEVDDLIRRRERNLKGPGRAKLNRTKEFDHSIWVGGGELDYRFSNARRIINDIYHGEGIANV